jgi:SAM-dependent methyltransferase
MKTIKDIAELDVMLSACDAAASDDELRLVLGSFQMDMPPPADLDPLGPGYHDNQMALYHHIAGRSYDLTSEATPFDVDSAVVTPFPFSTGSSQTAGDHFVVMGEFLRHMRLSPGARVLEFGPGWGNLTLALAGLGYRVTAVDIEPRFCDLIRRRAERLGVAVNVINADFGWAASVSESFDAVVFFECFHHAADHLGLLRNLHRAVAPGGRVYMGAEPILADFPIPWGLRMDGQSLWSIRKFGWMELGFRDDYFRAALAETGWAGTRQDVAYPAIWELTSLWPPLRFDARSGRLGTLTGRMTPAAVLLADAANGAGLFGPYVPLPAGDYLARVRFLPGQPLAGQATLEVTARRSEEVVAARAIDASAAGQDAPYLELPFTLAAARDDIEVRLMNQAGFSGSIEAVEIDPAP